MTDTRTIGQELQGQILETVSKSQEAVIDALKAWSDTIQSAGGTRGERLRLRRAGARPPAQVRRGRAQGDSPGGGEEERADEEMTHLVHGEPGRRGFAARETP